MSDSFGGTLVNRRPISPRSTASATSRTAQAKTHDRRNWQILSIGSSETIPYPPAFHITTIVLACIALILIALWAAATAGFESYTVFDTDFNRTDDKHWYTALLPDSVVQKQRGHLCDPVIFITGSTVQTNGIFKLLQYTITAYNIDGMRNAPNNTVAEYRGSKLSDCEVVAVGLTVRIRSGAVDIKARIRCPQPWPALLATSYSFDPGVSNALKGESTAYDEVFYWFDNLAIDLAYRIGEVFDSPMYTRNVTDDARGKWSMISADLVAPTTLLSDTGKNYTIPTEPELTIISMILSNPEESTWNATSSATGVTFGKPLVVYSDLIIPLTNHVQAFISLIQSDLGVLHNNIYVDSTALSQLIRTNDTLVNDSILQENDLYYTREMLDPGIGYKIDLLSESNMTNFQVLPDRAIATTYLCHVTRPKNAAAWLVSVVGLTLSIWAGLWQAYMLIVAYFVGRYRDSVPASPAPPVPSQRSDSGSNRSSVFHQGTCHIFPLSSPSAEKLRTEVVRSVNYW
ncbi:uncharacterized protein I303_106886 [Kwoniella dejecticola CBS 10117]|uniref:Uncharacterized protein n=1 Tax=Kwoniella dejecticola CBS 10117 TaxID=1296121 RepID=A0A1A5ZTE6_9TREE|nr:uncharacterized protein I303_08475 [Kwoniella dejecticola CBS 10117]OBR81093.1 hypothetical protein I303_08475 [Kwoniella dejecticola CBS 10117]